MNMTSERHWKKITFALIALVSFIVYGYFYIHNSKPAERMKAGINLNGSEEELAPWKNGEFVDATAIEAAHAIRGVIHRNAFTLSPVQRTGLSDFLVKFLHTYSSGSFESYLSFKTNRADYAFDFESLTAEILKVAAKEDPLRPIPEEPLLKAKRVWETVTAAELTTGLGPRLLKIEPNSVTILIETNRTASSGVLDIARKSSTMYPNSAPNSLIVYAQNPEKIIQQGGFVLTASFQVVAKYSTGEAPTPVFFSFYWDDSTDRWYPWEMAKYPASGFRVMF
jgi:hypothetical protein